MNAVAPVPVRLSLTLDDVGAMARFGVLREPEKVELIGGELVEMPADGPRHRSWSDMTGRWLYTRLSGYRIIPGQTLALSESDGPKPDWYVYSAELRQEFVGGADVLLAIELADTSLDRDLGWKADLYARYGVREYWVIDVNAARTRVHLDPTPEGYDTRSWYEADHRLEARHIPGFSMRLSDLE